MAVLLFIALFLGVLLLGADQQRHRSAWLGQLAEGTIPQQTVAGEGLQKGRELHRAGSSRSEADASLLLEISGALLESGVGLTRLLEVLGALAGGAHGAYLSRLGQALTLGAAWTQALAAAGRPPETLKPLLAQLGFAAHSGIAAAPSLYGAAAALRRQHRMNAQKAAGALGVRLVVPLGLCSLPAFLCLGVVPIVLALVPSAGT